MPQSAIWYTTVSNIPGKEALTCYFAWRKTTSPKFTENVMGCGNILI
ncbi:hypothetical protein KAR34_07680 [bacterium]|nr:hypothetical protein [bacterium]